ncbi:MAG: hypothetical protein HYR85_10685 [Planctomycetes bacterium]|nr:hypothetical protein [Planctomycetota bacterium]MBI3844431.1 hypothetical protein [Planctomycetota bacterium]
MMNLCGRDRTRKLGFGRFAHAAVALAFLLSYVTAFVHFGLVQHVVCAEHGEETESQPLDTHASCPPDLDCNHVVKTLSLTAGQLVENHHEHCLVAMLRQPGTRPNLEFRKLTHTPLVDRGAIPATTVLVLDSFPLYLLAPSHSPPA